MIYALALTGAVVATGVTSLGTQAPARRSLKCVTCDSSRLQPVAPEQGPGPGCLAGLASLGEGEARARGTGAGRIG